jgi:acyl-CoA thioesterase-2
MSARPPRESLCDMLTIDERATGGFAARLESFWGGSERGDALARATLAACAHEDRPLAAIQARFAARTPPDVDLSLSCEAATADRRRVLVALDGRTLCEVDLRFGSSEAGLSYQCATPEAGLPAPEALPSERETAEQEGWGEYAVGPIESRRIGKQTPVREDEPAVWLGWLRPRLPLPTGQARLQAAALAFLSLYRSHWAVERRLGADFPRSEITLLDHSLWIHRPRNWDDFWLVKTLADVGVGGRCFSRREIYSREGALLASAAWEALVHTPEG